MKIVASSFVSANETLLTSTVTGNNRLRIRNILLMPFIASSLTKTRLQTVVLDVHLPNPDGSAQADTWRIDRNDRAWKRSLARDEE
jgi:hypothetical protein